MFNYDSRKTDFNLTLSGLEISFLFEVNRYRRERPKVDTSIFDLALSHTRRSDASEKKEEPSVSTFGRIHCGQVSSPRLYRLNLILRKKEPPIKSDQIEFSRTFIRWRNFKIWDIYGSYL